MRLLTTALALFVTLVASANPIREYRQKNEQRILRELVEFLSIPNIATDDANIRRNAQHLIGMLEQRGIAARLLESPAGGPPAVFGELRSPGARRTIVMYAHYDGQPVSPSDWKTDPWRPTFLSDPEMRVYARSASDDKGPIIAMLAALDALRASGVQPAVNLKFFYEGEEEAGSPHLGPLLEKHKELLAADGWIFCDGPRHSSGAMQVVFGVRGTTGVTLTTFGPARALHSGHYGNWAPNPISILIDLLASMRDANGKVKIGGYSDDVRPPAATELDAAAALPNAEKELRTSLAVARPEGEPLPSRLLAPAVNFTGIRSGTVGADAVNAIQPEASASIDFRLVPNQTPEGVRRVVEEHIRRQGFTIVHERPTHEQRLAHERLVQLSWNEGYAAARTSIDLPFSQSVLRVVEKATGAKPLVIPTFGGSLPLVLFQQTLQTPFAIVPVVNSDNNQHAANENLRIQNLWDAIEIFAKIYQEP